jgi:hypothetical protein
MVVYTCRKSGLIVTIRRAGKRVRFLMTRTSARNRNWRWTWCATWSSGPWFLFNVLCDEHFGQNPGFLDGIAALGKWYFAEVPSDTRVWLNTPAVEPPGPSLLGRPRIRLRLKLDAPRAQEVREIAAHWPKSKWQRLTIQEGSKGPLVAEFVFLRVTTVRNRLPGPRL